MKTVVAFSYRGALKLYMAKAKNLKKGDYISVKPRGHGEWRDYKVH